MKNAIQILSDRASKSPKIIEMYKKEKEKFLKQIEKRKKNA